MLFGKEVRIFLLVSFLLLFFSSSIGFAHKVEIFAWIDDDTIYTESYFQNGDFVRNGKIEVLNREKKPVYDGWVIGRDGNPLTDPKTILEALVEKRAALLPLGGTMEIAGSHKGYGLSTIVEILSSSLQSGAFLFSLSGVDSDGEETRFKVGHFFLVINIENFVPIEQFKKNIGDLLRTLRSTGKLPGKDRVYTAGEKEYEVEKQIKEKGVPINPNLFSDLQYIDNLLEIGFFNE